MKIRIVIFDLDGTLMDAYVAVWQSINHTFKSLGLPPCDHETIKRSVGWGDKRLLKAFVGNKNLKKALEIYRVHHAKALKKGTKFLPGALSILKFLKAKGIRLAVASNRPSFFSKIALKTLKIHRYFDYVICADQVRQGKPSPQMFFKILKKFRLKPQEALYVGDMTIDAMAGRRAQIPTVVVLTGSSRYQEVAVYKPFKIVRSLKGVKEIFLTQ